MVGSGFEESREGSGVESEAWMVRTGLEDVGVGC